MKHGNRQDTTSHFVFHTLCKECIKIKNKNPFLGRGYLLCSYNCPSSSPSLTQYVLLPVAPTVNISMLLCHPVSPLLISLWFIHLYKFLWLSCSTHGIPIYFIILNNFNSFLMSLILSQSVKVTAATLTSHFTCLELSSIFLFTIPVSHLYMRLSSDMTEFTADMRTRLDPVEIKMGFWINKNNLQITSFVYRHYHKTQKPTPLVETFCTMNFCRSQHQSSFLPNTFFIIINHWCL